MHFFQTTTIGINEYKWVHGMPRFINIVWRYQREVIRIRKSKKNRQHNDQKKKNRQHNDQKKKDKKTNNDLQNIIHKTKDQVTRTLLKTGVELRCSGRVSSFCSTLYQSFIKNMNHITREIFNNGYWYPRHYLMKGIIFFYTQIFFLFISSCYIRWIVQFERWLYIGVLWRSWWSGMWSWLLYLSKYNDR